MAKMTWTKREILDAIRPYALENGLSYGFVNPTPEVINVIMAVERIVYNAHLDSIQKRKDKLKKLWQDDHKFLAIWNGTFEDLTDGCYACLSDKYAITHVRNSAECTQDCDFCYYRNPQAGMVPGTSTRWSYPKNTYTFSDQAGSAPVCTLEEAKLIIDKQVIGNKLVTYGAVGWLQKEPLQALKEMLPVMEYLASFDMHQYLYTNGVFANKKVFRQLQAAGLREIRFNLQATDFDPKIIDRMGIARDYFKSVCIETPIYSKSYDNFVQKRNIILDTNLDQINMPELQACSQEQYLLFRENEGLFYKHRRGYVSPISSRHYVYNLIELAEEEEWDVVINDCSNDTKYYRGVQGMAPPGVINYPGEIEVPMYDVMLLVEEYLDEEKEYEFF